MEWILNPEGQSDIVELISTRDAMAKGRLHRRVYLENPKILLNTNHRCVFPVDSPLLYIYNFQGLQ
jgi:hypothetical protein